MSAGVCAHVSVTTRIRAVIFAVCVSRVVYVHVKWAEPGSGFLILSLSLNTFHQVLCEHLASTHTIKHIQEKQCHTHHSHTRMHTHAYTHTQALNTQCTGCIQAFVILIRTIGIHAEQYYQTTCVENQPAETYLTV